MHTLARLPDQSRGEISRKQGVVAQTRQARKALPSATCRSISPAVALSIHRAVLQHLDSLDELPRFFWSGLPCTLELLLHVR